MSNVKIDLVIASAPSEEDIFASEFLKGFLTLEDLFAGQAVNSGMNQGLSGMFGEGTQWKSEPLYIPDREAREWQRTHPLEQIRWTTEKNRLTNGHYVNVVRLVKWWWRTMYPDLKYPKGYPLEHMVGDCCPDGITTVAEGFTLTLEEMHRRFRAYALNGAVPFLADRNVPEHNVLKRLTPREFSAFYGCVAEAARTARGALAESDSGKERHSVAGSLWKQIPVGSLRWIIGHIGRLPKRRIHSEERADGDRGRTIRVSSYSPRELPAQLAVGRRALEGLSGYRLVDDFSWNEDEDCWILHCAIEADVKCERLVPRETFWYIFVQDSYPWGTIAFYPAKKGGITRTFQHQNYNGPGAAGVAWRTGRLCVDTGMQALGREAYDIEPFQPEDRLAWHLTRVRQWLKLASKDELGKRGDPFELPYVPTVGQNSIVFSEGPAALPSWLKQRRRSGRVQLNRLRDDSPVLLADGFFSNRGEKLIQPEWGKALGSPLEGLDAWLMLNEVPVLEPWQIPMNWGEFRAACKLQGVDLDSVLRQAVSGLRDATSHALLVGFPIPARIGAEHSQIHWLALQLPPLTTAVMPGFRATDEGFWRYDRTRHFHDSAALNWLKTENWAHAEITGRGRVSDDAGSKSYLVIGAGAVGSAVAELLVRSGVRKLTVIDNDSLEVGNLVRHTLTVDDIGNSKAPSLAARLNGAAIHSSVKSISEHFPPRDPKCLEQILDCDVVVDCTASDAVLESLSRQDWEKAGYVCVTVTWIRRAPNVLLLCLGDEISEGQLQRET